MYFSQVTGLYDWQAWHCFLSSVRMGQYLLWSKRMTLQSVAIAGFFQPGPTVLIYYYSHLSWLFVWSFSDLSVSQDKTLSNFLWVKSLQAFSALSLKHLIAFEDKDIPTMHLFLQHEPYATKILFGRVVLTSSWYSWKKISAKSTPLYFYYNVTQFMDSQFGFLHKLILAIALFFLKDLF